MEKKIQPLGANVLVRVQSVAKTTQSGLYIPEAARSRQSQGTLRCKVLAIGSMCEYASVGEIVYIPADSLYDEAAPVSADEDVYIVSEKFIIATEK